MMLCYFVAKFSHTKYYMCGLIFFHIHILQYINNLIILIIKTYNKYWKIAYMNILRTKADTQYHIITLSQHTYPFIMWIYICIRTQREKKTLQKVKNEYVRTMKDHQRKRLASVAITMGSFFLLILCICIYTYI